MNFIEMMNKELAPHTMANLSILGKADKNESLFY